MITIPMLMEQVLVLIIFVMFILIQVFQLNLCNTRDQLQRLLVTFNILQNKVIKLTLEEYLKLPTLILETGQILVEIEANTWVDYETYKPKPLILEVVSETSV